MIKPMLDNLMVQQQIKAPHKRWKHMVAVMCLNLTYRKQVKIVLPKLFKRYPNPKAYLSGRLKTQQQILKPLGMWQVRSKRIRKMTEQFLKEKPVICMALENTVLTVTRYSSTTTCHPMYKTKN